MRKPIALILMVVGIYTGIEIYNEGLHGAFGGALTRFSSALDAPAERGASDRSADAFQRAYDKSESRVEKLLDDQDPGR